MEFNAGDVVIINEIFELAIIHSNNYGVLELECPNLGIMRPYAFAHELTLIEPYGFRWVKIPYIEYSDELI